MVRHSRVDIIKPDHLSAEDIRLWQGFMAERDDLIGPYFDVRYVMAIGQSVPKAFVARLYAGDRVAGFFPFQRRGRTIQPLGAPLTDYHGIIGRRDLQVDFKALLKSLGAQHLVFQGWVGPMNPKARTTHHTRRIADLSKGYDAWFETQKSEHHKFFKNIGRCIRNVEKDFGGFEFSWEMATSAIIEWIIEQKRLQYKRSGLHDVFTCGWTLTLLKTLAGYQDQGFGLRVGVFRHEGNLVAAEICLVKGDNLHFWFPAYAESYGRYSPGILLSMRIMQHVEALGVKRVDFGCGGEQYKHVLTTPETACLEGVVSSVPSVGEMILDQLVEALPVMKSRIKSVRLSLRRRFNIIQACEVSASGWLKAMGGTARRALSRAANDQAA
ncbi:GNAT family N-acetyltransferase [Asticcacaulis machinosus]|uniref:GNAT family N-acetyltransferase n=1 Tax=Asticcacaulis machinosus TaxID=2984211 RepID=A0ABT5HHH3_9CAUL|nr:GNAT family N-acetyltransferase [Asticcacaulis machinosus]MDC7675694.1 GNAT family N-acetyltransferase [Asticcacaulis machinosus]